MKDRENQLVLLHRSEWPEGRVYTCGVFTSMERAKEGAKAQMALFGGEWLVDEREHEIQWMRQSNDILLTADYWLLDPS